MNKRMLLVIVIAIVVAGIGVTISSGTIRFGFGSGSSGGGLNPRMMAIAVLPILIPLYYFGRYIRSKNEDRKWKSAIKKNLNKK